jgi:hypothetical protein
MRGVIANRRWGIASAFGLAMTLGEYAYGMVKLATGVLVE